MLDILTCDFYFISNIAIKARGLAWYTTRFNALFSSQENGHCYVIVSLCVTF